jgi:uncharacterized membrane protein YeaQ/YmgE (transglycosylase-associated protein family)
MLVRFAGREKYMYWFLWIFVGFVAGWLTGRSLEGEGYGRFMDIAMGIGGAVVGGFLTHTAGISGAGATILASFAAVVGAIVFTTVAALFTGRRVYTRQL